MRKKWLVFLAILIGAAGFRIAVAHWLPNDAPDDGRVYAQIARNVLEQHSYSLETQAPYDPTLIRLPGYPVFLASIYSIFGHTNNGAVRIVQALIDTATCALVALLAFYWQPDEKRKRATAIAALALAAVCPFTTIYSATILTEVPTTFLVMVMLLAATLAFRKTFTTADTEETKGKDGFKHSIRWWIIAGLLGGLAVLFRPDTGLFVAAVGIVLVGTGIRRVWSAVAERSGDGTLDLFPSPFGRGAREERLGRKPPRHPSPIGGGSKPPIQSGVAPRLSPRLLRTLAAGALFTFAFVLVLAPWTIRNARVFHLFQPLAPSHGEMPGEFVPRGYQLWLRTWLDDERYIAPFLWSLDDQPISIDDVPASAFDSAEERNRVATLLDKYSHPPGAQVTTSSSAQPQPTATPQPSPTPTPSSKTSTAKATPRPTIQSSQNSNAKQAANANANSDAEDTGDEGDQNDNSSDQADESDNSDSEQSDQSKAHGPVEMTPDIDAGFAQVARERIARHPLRFYFWLPLKRAHTMWFDTHSQYWPFEGDLLPLEDLDYEHHQQFWLPLFAGLTAIYTLLGLAGGWLLWSSGKSVARKWFLLTALAILLRFILFSSMENPEPRYLVEFFPFLSILGGITLARVPRLFRPRMNTDSR